MTTWEKVFAMKLDGRGSVPTTPRVEGKNQLLKVVLGLHSHATMCVCIPHHHSIHHTIYVCVIYIYIYMHVYLYIYITCVIYMYING